MQLPKTSAPGHSRHPPDNRTETATETASPEYGHAARWHARSRDFRILTITRQAIRRGSFTSVQDLITAIENFIDGWNDRCHPFTWTKTDEITPALPPR